jgi:hypothetical protein
LDGFHDCFDKGSDLLWAHVGFFGANLQFNARGNVDVAFDLNVARLAGFGGYLQFFTVLNFCNAF